MTTHRFEDLARKYLDVVTDSGTEFMCRCPFHEDSSPSLQFNVEKGLWICFQCEQGGTAKSLIKRIGGTYSEPAVSVQILQKSLDRLVLKDKEGAKDVFLPESYLARFASEHEYWTDRRGFSSATIQKWGLGYDPISDRCTIAYRSVEGALLGVIYRRLDNEFPRYLYPSGFNRTGSLFGSWAIADGESSSVALVEGSTDVINLDQAEASAVGQYGSSISLNQIRLLRFLNIREVILFHDYDNGGRKATRQAKGILEGFIVRQVKWDTEKYCWHDKLCGCGRHTWDNLPQCKRKLFCKCGRIHCPDPGKLEAKEIQYMLNNAELVGRKRDARTKW